jgi:phosphoketolase
MDKGLMDAQAALAFVREHGVVLASARGPVPTLTHAIAGEAIKGSWWGHPQGKHIFAVMNAVNEDPDILVCRLLANKITLVHRRLWPALAACAAAFDPACLARVAQEHSARGHHENMETPFPDWLPAGVMEEANRLDRDAALAALGSTFVTKPGQRNPG